MSSDSGGDAGSSSQEAANFDDYYSEPVDTGSVTADNYGSSSQTSSFDYESEAAGISNYAGSNFNDGQGDDRNTFDYEGEAYGTTPSTTPTTAPTTTPTSDDGFPGGSPAYYDTPPDYSLGDPDPDVDTPLSERDTITSFTDNLSANIRSNPLGILTPTSTLLKNAGQTLAANYMLGNLSNPFSIGGGSSVDYTDPTYSYESDGDTQSYLAPLAPYAVGGTPVQQSQVLQNQAPNSSLSSDLETSYNNAKASVAQTMSINPLAQQFGYSTAPYGALTAQNTGTNPFNIPYLQTRGLI